MPKPKVPKPVEPLKRHATEYEAALRRIIIDPIARPLFRLARKGATAARLLRQARKPVDLGAKPENLAVQVVRVAYLYHRQKTISTFKAAGYDIETMIDNRPPVGQIRAFYTRQFPHFDENQWGIMPEQVEEEVRYMVRENARLIRTIPPRFLDRLTDDLTALMTERPQDLQAVSKLLTERYEVTGWNMRRLARDQTTKLAARQTQLRHRQLGIEQYTWISSLDERTRPTHRALHDRVFSWDKPPSIGHPGTPVLCFPGSVRILPAGLQASVSYRYVGQLIEITCADGVQVSMTPNHPVLTETGWKRACDLDEGDELLKHRGGSDLAFASSDPQVDNRYAFAEHLHDLSGDHRVRSGSVVLGVDLHGDRPIGDEEVDIVTVPRHLRDTFHALGHQVFTDFNLMRTPPCDSFRMPLGHADPRTLRSSEISRGLMGRVGQLHPFGRGETCHAPPVRLRSVPAMQSEVVHAGIRDLAADPQLGRNLYAVLSGIGKPLDVGMGGASRFVPVRVTSRRATHFDGPVYNFQTFTGLIIANGIATHNCRCNAAAVISEKFLDTVGAKSTPKPKPPSPAPRPTYQWDPNRFSIKFKDQKTTDWRTGKRPRDYVDEYDLDEGTQYYFAEGYESLNETMRDLATGRSKALHPADKAVIDGLKRDYRKLESGETVFRGIPETISSEVGDEIPLLTPTSTSISGQVATWFGGGSNGRVGTMWEIRAPKGSKAIVSNATELEYNLQMGQKLRIIGRFDDAKIDNPWGGDPITIGRYYVAELIH